MNWTKRASGTGFSYVLIIDGYPFYSFGNLSFKQNADGMGISGVSAAEFDFSVAYEEYAYKTPKSGAEVLFGIEGSDVTYSFFVSQRSRNGGKVTFKCYDRMILLGISTDTLDIPYTDVSEDDENSGTIAAFSLVKYLAEVINFNGCTDSIGEIGGLNLKKSDIKGKTARALLETISAAWCGYFTVSANNYLDFVRFGSSFHTICPVITHSAIEMRSERSEITRVVAYKGSDYFYSGDEKADVLSTLTVQTEFASQEYADALLQRVKGYTYRSWELKKAIIDVPNLHNGYLPTISTTMSKYHVPDGVDGLTEFTANSLNLNFTDTGIYATLSSNEVTEDEYAYLGYISRKLGEKISDGEKLGNDTLITRYQGLVHLGEKKKDETTGEVKQNRYGYSKATSDGVVEFSGAMKSKKYPGIALNADLSGFKMKYEDTSFDFEVVIDGDNVTLKEKEKEGD